MSLPHNHQETNSHGNALKHPSIPLSTHPETSRIASPHQASE